MDTGFGHLKDGTYRSVEHTTMSKRELVQTFQRRRAIGEMPPVYPNGWFCLLESEDVPPGEVRHVAALGENFAVFRTTKGILLKIIFITNKSHAFAEQCNITKNATFQVLKICA